ncbi:stigma-specific STIG1-like protein 4 [Prosopis cineraria]|uniref:stigma-specific STIG1-like protein 4 n=1 Tax=Prosopis cineraria TaxID=364024 RepID=UPI00240F9F43|nr:stigma-specific STIG1-like protein 4 [Prosopis cineraria]
MALQESKLLMLFLLILSIKIDATYEHATSGTVSSSSSSWLKKVAHRPRHIGCSKRPLMCSRGEFPPRRLCCRNRCVDVKSDRNNCGFCGVRCVFNMQCCAGLCTDTNIDPFNCGSCGNVCSLGNLCVFGLCGYAQQPPPPLPPSCPPTPPSPPPPCPPIYAASTVRSSSSAL